jgi:hypothetical protein
MGLSSDEQELAVAQTTFTILDEPAPRAVVSASRGILRRTGPSIEAPNTQEGGLGSGVTVTVLGKTNGQNDAGNQALWCFWQTQDNNVRRGWTLCEYLVNGDGVPFDQDNANLPWLTPSEPVTSS